MKYKNKKRVFVRVFGGLFVSLLLAACTAGRVDLAPAALSRLADLSAQPEQVGGLVYQGQVFPDDGEPTASSVFRYERRVPAEGDELVAWHLTFDGGVVMVSQQAASSASYDLHTFEEVNQQTGVRSRIAVGLDGGLVFTQFRGDQIETRSEGTGPPVVVGPTLFGFVLGKWKTLVAGEPVRVRFAAADLMQSFEFDLSITQQTARTTVVSFKPTSFWVRLAVETMFLTFDSETLNIVRYQGAVPPKLSDQGSLTPFTARVDYTFATASYQ